MKPFEQDIEPRAIQPESGLAFMVRLDRRLEIGDDLEDSTRSGIELFEDGKPLGPGHAGHSEIREEGSGRFSHWGEHLIFSTSDGSDPKSNGRTYRVTGARRRTVETPSQTTVREAPPVPCPCCGFASYLKPYQKRNDYDGWPIAIDVCTFCTSLVNRTELEKALSDVGASLDKQESWSREFYATEIGDEEMNEGVSSYRRTVQAMLNDAIEPVARNVAIDLGAGLGYLSAGAAEYFRESWALEINPATLRAMQARMGQKNAFKIGTSLDDVPTEASVITAWHSLEHIPELWKVGEAIAAKLEPGGVFYWQVPMFRDEYVVSSHYTFLNETAARVLCERIGLTVEGIWFDLSYQFLTCMARKPGDPRL